MANFVHVNFFKTTISSAITSSDTSINLGSTTGAPTISTGYNWPLILTANGIYEIVYVTALNGATATVSRGQEGTAALGWSNGTTILDGFTAASVLYQGQTIPFSAITGTLGNAQILSGAVTQFESDLTVAFSQLTGTAANAQIPKSAVTQYQSYLAIAASQVSGLAASATTNTTNASNISSGTLSNSRLNLPTLLESLMLSSAVTLEADPGGTPANGTAGTLVLYY